MHHRATLLAGVSALLFTASALQPAMAAAPVGFAGTAGASYGQTSCDGCVTEDVWNVNGSGAFGFTPNLGGQLDLSYSNVSEPGFNLNLYGIGGSIFYAPGMWRAGATFRYDWFSESGFDVNMFSYGVFGEYYFSNFVTVGLRGGGDTIDVGGGGGSESGGYVGAALIGYIVPNLAVTPSVDYLSISDLSMTNVGIGLEFLVSPTFPISVSAGYTRSHIDAFGSGGDADIWFIGLRIYTNGNGVTLVERHRNGNVGWAAQSNFGGLLPAL